VGINGAVVSAQSGGANVMTKAPVIAELRAAGITSKKDIAKALNKPAICTRRGVGHWAFDTDSASAVTAAGVTRRRG
jgi:hypothetical protein